jgi:hypothetical protein
MTNGTAGGAVHGASRRLRPGEDSGRCASPLFRRKCLIHSYLRRRTQVAQCLEEWQSGAWRPGDMMTIKPMAAAVAGALISGVAMYTVGAKTATVDAFTQTPALVQTLDGQYVQSQPMSIPRAQLVSSPSVARPAATARRTVTRRQAAPVQGSREVYREETPDQRTWQKTTMIIGGSAASGAGVGAIMGGKKGALIGAAIGGGAASIYESTKRR